MPIMTSGIEPKATKIMMFVMRMHDGERQFFVLDRKDGTFVVPTGHVGDNVLGESLKDAAIRELGEELCVKPEKVLDLNYSREVFLESQNKLSEEHGFLLEIPDVEVEYTENDYNWRWCSIDELNSLLTYDGQRNAIEKIKDHIGA